MNAALNLMRDLLRQFCVIVLALGVVPAGGPLDRAGVFPINKPRH
jgi:hypothetical protein